MKPKELITSTSNSIFREVSKLYEPKNRKKFKLSLVEGIKEIEQILNSNKVIIKQIIICEEIYKNIFDNKLITNPNIKIHYFSYDLFKKISFRENSDGIIIIFEPKTEKELNFYSTSKKILILDGIEKPGNIGAMLRTADATNFELVILTNFKGDIYNPNIIRSSLGLVFNTNIVQSIPSEVITFANKNNITLYLTSLQTENNIYDVKFPNKTGIIIGSEMDGAKKEWYTYKNINKIKIPMKGKANSLNASVTFGIVAYEILRQSYICIKKND